MHWHSLNEFFAMGGYAFYVWGSFGLAALLAIWEISSLHYRRQKAIQQIKRQLNIESNEQLVRVKELNESKT